MGCGCGKKTNHATATPEQLTAAAAERRVSREADTAQSQSAALENARAK